jgi:hypothetical protein
MRVSHLEREHLLVLDETEAQCLADACALLVCASSVAEGCHLPQDTCQLLTGVFSALTSRCPET